MIVQPKLSQLLAEMQEMSVDELLIHIQRHALPYLILNRKNDVIQKLTEIRNESDPWQTCLDKSNLGCILALLLTQDTEDVEQYTMSLMRQISSHFNDFTLVDLLQIEPLATTLNMLKTIADADESRKPHVRFAKLLSSPTL